jgi:hypothetical protein
VPLEQHNFFGAKIEEECQSGTAIRIPIPKKNQTELWSGFGIDKIL